MKTDGSLILMFFKYPEPAFFGNLKEPYNTGFNTEYAQSGWGGRFTINHEKRNGEGGRASEFFAFRGEKQTQSGGGKA